MYEFAKPFKNSFLLHILAYIYIQVVMVAEGDYNPLTSRLWAEG